MSPWLCLAWCQVCPAQARGDLPPSLPRDHGCSSVYLQVCSCGPRQVALYSSHPTSVHSRKEPGDRSALLHPFLAVATTSCPFLEGLSPALTSWSRDWSHPVSPGLSPHLSHHTIRGGRDLAAPYSRKRVGKTLPVEYLAHCVFFLCFFKTLSKEQGLVLNSSSYTTS